MNRFSRLTTGQAVVRFLAHQFAERDGQVSRFIEGIWAIFGPLPLNRNANVIPNIALDAVSSVISR